MEETLTGEKLRAKVVLDESRAMVISKGNAVP